MLMVQVLKCILLKNVIHHYEQSLLDEYWFHGWGSCIELETSICLSSKTLHAVLFLLKCTYKFYSLISFIFIGKRAPAKNEGLENTEFNS